MPNADILSIAPPRAFRPLRFLLGLRAPEALAQIVAANPNVTLVACGHVHRTISTIWAGRPCKIAPAPDHSVRFALRPDAPAGFDWSPARCWFIA